MAITTTADLVFENQITLEHAFGYFDKKLGWVSLLTRFVSDFDKVVGNKVTIPYFNVIGAAETPTEGTDYAIDKLGDNQITATANLVGKAVGLTEETEIQAGFSLEEWMEEAINQTTQRIAEAVQDKIIAEYQLSTSHEEVDETSDHTFTTAFDGKKNINTDIALEQRCNVRNLTRAEQEAFGDKRSQVQAYVLHSRQMVDLETDKEAGFLKADANSPFNFLDEFRGTIFNKPVLEFDDVPKGDKIVFTDSNSATQKFQSYKALLIKPNSMGLIVKRDLLVKFGEAIVSRQKVFTNSQWYGVKSFHKKISNLDKRAALVQFLTAEETT